jgi:hypothetical protein
MAGISFAKYESVEGSGTYDKNLLRTTGDKFQFATGLNTHFEIDATDVNNALATFTNDVQVGGELRLLGGASALKDADGNELAFGSALLQDEADSSGVTVNGALSVTGNTVATEDLTVGKDAYVLGNVFLGIQNQGSNLANAPSTVFVGDAWGESGEGGLYDEQQPLIDDITTVLAVAGDSTFRGDIGLTGDLTAPTATITSLTAPTAEITSLTAPSANITTLTAPTTTVTGDLAVTGKITGNVQINQVVSKVSGDLTITAASDPNTVVAFQSTVKAILTTTNSSTQLVAASSAAFFRILIAAKGSVAGYTKATELMVAFDGVNGYTTSDFAANTGLYSMDPIDLQYSTNNGTITITAAHVPAAGDVNLSAIVTAMGGIADITDPIQPAQPTVSGITSTQVTVNFTKTSASADVASWGLQLYDANDAAIGGEIDLAAYATSIDIGSLTATTTYKAALVATDTSGNKAESSKVSFTTA